MLLGEEITYQTRIEDTVTEMKVQRRNVTISLLERISNVTRRDQAENPRRRLQTRHVQSHSLLAISFVARTMRLAIISRLE